MEEEKNTTEPVVGDSGKTPDTQATPPVEQSTEQQQKTVETPVEVSEQQTSSDEEARKPSDFYRDRQRSRRKIESLEDQLSEMRSRMDSLSKPAAPSIPEPTPFNRDEFYENPEVFLEKYKTEASEQGAKKAIELYKKEQGEQILVKQEQEALDLLFPKSDKSTSASWKERSEDNPERTEQIHKLLVETGLDDVSRNKPVEAVKTVLKLYAMDQSTKAERKQNPDAIKKSLMGSTATSSQPKGEATMPDINQLRQQAKKMEEDLDKNPKLRNDPEFKKNRAALKDAYTEFINTQKK